MASLKVGYDMFAGAQQGGSVSGQSGVVQVETAKSTAYYLKVQRLSDNYYWNDTTKVFQAGAVAQADEIEIPGSVSHQANTATVRRLQAKLPDEATAEIDGSGCVITAYADGDTPGSDGVSITLAYSLV
jgi:hypothetical protein